MPPSGHLSRGRGRPRNGGAVMRNAAFEGAPLWPVDRLMPSGDAGSAARRADAAARARVDDGAPHPPSRAVKATAEQRAAVADRGRSSLLAAGAGSGKTSVMVERFCEAVLDDGVAVGAVLALTFTEKAAGELRERIRRRFVELGEDEHARAVDGAWIGTIHGFCA